MFRHTAAVLLTALAITAGPAPAHAAPGEVTWTVRTGGAQRSSFSYDISPGATSTDTMVVANRGAEPVTLAVYAADGYTTDAGRLDLLAGADESKNIGAWVRPEQSTVTVPPGRIAEIPFRISVPGNATPGDHVGGIVTSLTAADRTAPVDVERRLGIKMKIRVAGALAPALAVENLGIDYRDSAATVSYTLHNTGNAVQSARQAVTVSGPFGWFRTGAAAIAAPPELLPGESWQVTVLVPDVSPAVLLTGTVTVTPLLTDASGSTTALDPVTATAHTPALPWTYLALLLLLIVAVILIARRRAGRRKREDARVREAVEQALREKETAG